jgi:hypothetical protein
MKMEMKMEIAGTRSKKVPYLRLHLPVVMWIGKEEDGKEEVTASWTSTNRQTRQASFERPENFISP